LYYFGSGSTTVSAISRDIIEADLIEQFGWLPKEIAEIPYKKLQKLSLIRKQKNTSLATKKEISNMKNTAKSKKTYREI
jgi:hypothetical protein